MNGDSAADASAVNLHSHRCGGGRYRHERWPERFDIYTRDGVHRGVKDRADVHRDGDWHRSVHIWIVRRSERALLIQQRAADKDTWPGYWDASVGGHLSAGERYEDAYREIEEELGVTIDPQTFVELGIIAIELTPPEQPQHHRPGALSRGPAPETTAPSMPIRSTAPS